MEDGDDFEHMKKHLQEAEKSLKRSSETMVNSMMEQMAPFLIGGQMLGDEAKAWDSYVCAFARSGEDMAASVQLADDVLALRRKRFNRDVFTEQMRGMLPSGKELCDEPVLKNDGTDTGMRCTRNKGHDSPSVHY